MALIELTGDYELIPEGTYVFCIKNVKYNERFGKLEITLETQDGLKHIERYSLLNAKGQQNTGAYNAFSYFAKKATGDASLTQIDPDDLVGCFIEADVEHETVPSTKKEGEFFTFVTLGEKRSSDGWDEAMKKPEPKEAPKMGGMDLKALLG